MASGGHGGHGGMSGMPGMGTAMPMSPEQMHELYDVFTVNGKAGEAVPPLEVRQGERVRIRLINAGYQTHYLHLHGHRFRVTHTDGQPLPDRGELRDVLVAVAPGERYDLEFVADNPGAW
jgi:FtsP/CotA-like multicopper oxidase with cupredoxin domain